MVIVMIDIHSRRTGFQGIGEREPAHHRDLSLPRGDR